MPLSRRRIEGLHFFEFINAKFAGTPRNSIFAKMEQLCVAFCRLPFIFVQHHGAGGRRQRRKFQRRGRRLSQESRGLYPNGIPVLRCVCVMKYITASFIYCCLWHGVSKIHVRVRCAASALVSLLLLLLPLICIYLLTCLRLAVFFHLLFSGKVSRKATLHHAGSIELRGKSIVESGASIHGISSPPSSSGTGRSRKVRIGRYCYIGPNVALRPATMPSADDDVDFSKA